jgi:hypothetical protein
MTDPEKTEPNADVVEAVARAIATAFGSPWDWFSDEGQEAARTEAKAALSAMPAPSAEPVGWMPLPKDPGNATPQPTPAQIRTDALREAANAVIGYIHPYYPRLPGKPFASAQILALIGDAK